MGTVFKRTSTKSLPVGAEFIFRKGQRFAKWLDAKGRTRTAGVIVPTDGKFAGQERIAIETPTYFADYRDGSGHLRRVATGCRDESAARAVLGELERRAELVKAGVMTVAEDNVADHQTVPLANHIAAFAESMKAKNCTVDHQAKTERYLKRLAKECEFRLLGNLRKESFERWLVQKLKDG